MNSIHGVAKQFELNSKLLKNAIAGLSEEDGLMRMNSKTNHIRWIAGHLLTIRYGNAKRMKLSVVDWPYVDLYAFRDMPPPNARQLDESIAYPTLHEMRAYWDEYAAPINQALWQMSDEFLSSTMNFDLPINGKTMLDAFAFTALHESYHIGQVSMIRMAMGHKPMSFR